MGRQQIRCHGGEDRFEVLAKYIYDTFGSSVKYIADVAGGQGLLSRILNKKYNYMSEVIDPRGYTLKGIAGRQTEYSPEMACYYDLIVGLHPDEATRAVAESALYRPIIVIPCCNFWDREKKLGTKELVAAVAGYMDENHINYETVVFNFKGPKNTGIVTAKGN